MKDAHDKIIIADADSNDSEDDFLDEREDSFMTSRYETTFEDDISEGSGYQELQKPFSARKSHIKTKRTVVKRK